MMLEVGHMGKDLSSVDIGLDSIDDTDTTGVVVIL